MKLERSATYRHPNMIDLDIHIMRIENVTEESYWLEIYYVYRRNPKMVIGPDRVRMRREDWPKWVRIKGE